MTLLVTQEQALRQLRLSVAAISPDELADVMFKAEQASDIVVDYLKAPGAANYVTDNPMVNPLKRGSPRDGEGSIGGGGDWWAGGWWMDVGWGGYGPPQGPPPPLRVPQSPWDDNTAPVMIRGIVLMILTSLYDGRTPEESLLSPQMCAVLERYRDPALA